MRSYPAECTGDKAVRLACACGLTAAKTTGNGKESRWGDVDENYDIAKERTADSGRQGCGGISSFISSSLIRSWKLSSSVFSRKQKRPIHFARRLQTISSFRS